MPFSAHVRVDMRRLDWHVAKSAISHHTTWSCRGPARCGAKGGLALCGLRQGHGHRCRLGVKDELNGGPICLLSLVPRPDASPEKMHTADGDDSDQIETNPLESQAAVRFAVARAQPLHTPGSQLLIPAEWRSHIYW